MKYFPFFIFFIIINYNVVSAKWERCVYSTSSRNIICLATDSNHIFVGDYGHGVFSSSDDGNTWASNNNGLEDLNILALNIKPGYVFVGTLNKWGISFSTNYGISWINNINLLRSSYVDVITINNDKIYVSLDGCGIYMSNNNGDSWWCISPPTGHFLDAKAISSRGNNVFAFTQTGYLFSYTGHDETWVAKNNIPGIAGDGVILTNNGDSAFICTPKGIFLSTDNGDTWIAKNKGLLYPIQTMLILRDNIIAGSFGAGLFISTDKGDSWHDINDSLTNSLTIFAICLKGEYIYAGAGGGLFRAKLSELLIVDVPDNTKEQNFSLFPNPVSDYLELNFQNNNSAEIKIYNELGIPVYEKKMQDENNLKIDTRDYPPGVYFCQIKAGRYTETKKFIVFH